MEERTGSFKPIKNQRGKFNAVDLIIIFLLVIIAALVILSSSVAEWFSSDEDVTLEYVVEVQDLSAELVDNISVGDKVYTSDTETLIGSVVSVENTIPHTTFIYDEECDGIVTKEIPDRYDVRVTVVAEAKLKDGVGYSIDGRRISVGTGLNLRFPELLCSGYCITVKEG